MFIAALFVAIVWAVHESLDNMFLSVFLGVVFFILYVVIASRVGGNLIASTEHGFMWIINAFIALVLGSGLGFLLSIALIALIEKR
jgi:hypothetical protein